MNPYGGDIEQIENLDNREGDYESDNYRFVYSPARVAIYDNLLSSPHIIDIEPAPTRSFINNLATCVYSNSHDLGGEIPYSIILQVSENFIHAGFCEMIVSILDSGNTIKFSDQGPGIDDKSKAQQPGYSSATLGMKEIINGVGSGLPIVREYMETKNGIINIEDNIGAGSVITISLAKHSIQPLNNSNHTNNHAMLIEKSLPSNNSNKHPADIINLSPKAYSILQLFTFENVWGVKDIANELSMPLSSTHSELKKLEEAGIITKLGTKRTLTDFGAEIVKDKIQ